MKILGISSNYHDASASLVVDGKVVASSAEERFSYEKHDPSFPEHSIKFCLQQASLSAADLDYVVYHEDPQTKFTRSLAAAFKNFPFSMGSFLKSAKDMLSVGFWIKNDISRALNISPSKVIFSPHHLSHASHAFFTSPYKEAAIITIDAVGEWSTACIFKGYKSEDGYRIDPVDLIPFPHSLGLVYSAFTGFLGFKVNDGECSTMALAGFGNPKYINEIRKIIQIKNDGTFTIDQSYFDFSSDDKLPLTKKFTDIFGAPRDLSELIQFSSLEEIVVTSLDQQRYADIAASIQHVLEEAILAFAKRAQGLTGSDSLCYAGGVALNCVANAKLVQSKIFKNVYIPPDPGDGGGSMGAALYGAMVFDKDKVLPQKVSAYLGQDHPVIEDFMSMVEVIDPENWHRYSSFKIEAIKKENLNSRTFSEEEDLIEYVAKEIADKKVIGWIQGRFENGPRALGNRSILCRPDCIETAKRVSSSIKSRASFRPYACSILEEEASDFLELENNNQLKEWMQSAFLIKKEKWNKLRASSHIDETTRAQILKENENPLYYKLIKRFHKETGIPALLNTSFNLQGYPLVSSPYDAFLVFAKTNLDILVINKTVISKRN